MSDYQAPLKEMTLLVQHARTKAGLADMEMLADFDDEIISAVLDEASKLANRVLAPLNAVGDNEGCKFDDGKVSTPTGWKDAFQQFCEGGWMGLALPMDFGGQQLPRFIAQPVNEMWHSSNLAFVMFHALGQGGSEILMHFGSDELKAKYLEKIISGHTTVAMALTEPSAGSDFSELKTKAIPQDDGTYLIKGQKIYITYGEHDMSENIVHLVLARTPDAPEGSRGISLFAVPKYRTDASGEPGEFNDVKCTGIEHKTGLHGSPTCSMSYGDNDACYGELIGAENKGLMAMFILMNEARLSVGLQGVALGELGFQKAREYSLERCQGAHYLNKAKNVPIAQHPDVVRMLMSIQSQVLGMRSLGYLIAALSDKAEFCEDPAEKAAIEARIALLTPIFKTHSTEQANFMAGTAIQVFGGMGFVEETGVAQIMRDVRITTIYEGTTGVQARDLTFRKIKGDEGAAAKALLAEVAQTASALSADPVLSKLGSQLAVANAQLLAGLEKVVSDDPNLTQLHAGGALLLDAMGTLLCGWQLGEIAQIAQQKIAEGQDPDFHGNLVALARYYEAYYLPQVAAKLESFSAADAGIAEFKVEL